MGVGQEDPVLRGNSGGPHLAGSLPGWIGPIAVHLSSRPTLVALFVYAAIGTLTWAVGEATLPTIAAASTGPPPAPAPILAAAPLATATVMSMCLLGGMAQWEARAARSLMWMKLFNLALHLAASWACLYAAASRSAFDNAESMVAENLLASFAVVLLTAVAGRVSYAWLVLYPYGMVGIMASRLLPEWGYTVFAVNVNGAPRELTAASALASCALTAFLIAQGRSGGEVEPL